MSHLHFIITVQGREGLTPNSQMTQVNTSLEITLHPSPSDGGPCLGLSWGTVQATVHSQEWTLRLSSYHSHTWFMMNLRHVLMRARVQKGRDPLKNMAGNGHRSAAILHAKGTVLDQQAQCRPCCRCWRRGVALLPAWQPRLNFLKGNLAITAAPTVFDLAIVLYETIYRSKGKIHF